MTIRGAAAGIAAFVLAQGLFACWLHSLLYATHGPFYDSMVYTSDLARVIYTSRDQGMVTAIREAAASSTVLLPWIEAAVLASLLPVSRYTGIWMQEFWMLLLGWCLLWLFHRRLGWSAAEAFVYTLPFLSFRVVYAPSGGISDFRMDLSLYLLLAGMAACFLAAEANGGLSAWILSGLFLLAAVLNRATSPAYIVAMFGPLVLWRLMRGPRSRLAKGIAAGWLPAAVAAGLTLWWRWPLLHHYYFVAGADPTAKLPMHQAIWHLAFGGWSVGAPLTAAGLAVLWMRYREGQKPDWRLLWLGCAPVVLLVATGAGLNSLVSMPSVFGWLLFCFAPRPPRQFRLCAVLLMAACAANMAHGVWLHLHPPLLQPTRAAIDAAVGELAAMGGERVRFATAHVHFFGGANIANAAIFDFNGKPAGPDSVRLPSGVLLDGALTGMFSPPVELGWQDLPGAADDEKFEYLVGRATADLDAIFLPDEATIAWMEANTPYNFANRKVRELRKRLLATGVWVRQGDPLLAGPHESVELFVKKQGP